MKKKYDPHMNRLVFIESEATPDYWDKHWATSSLSDCLTRRSPTWVAKESIKHLSPGSIVLEGGCGNSQHVASLQKNGFVTIGIDYAHNTVDAVKRAAPHLDVRIGDVRNLKFDDSYFDAYWSLGVIEHFWDGYEDIAIEMSRVLKSGGKLFLTFPAMSPLRRFKQFANLYERSNFNQKPPGFYQFALDSDVVINFFKQRGFSLCKKKYMSGFKGIKDEVPIMASSFSRILRSHSLLSKIFIKAVEFLMSRFTGHVCYLILEKK